MSNIKLFRINQNQVIELKGNSAKIEKSLQDQIENNLETYLGVRFLATNSTLPAKRFDGALYTSGSLRDYLLNRERNRTFS